ncbi:MAG: DUF1326 domain-containing protein [Terriglobia bacterium]
MRSRSALVAILGLFLLPMALLAADAARNMMPHWEIRGVLSEACTCSVPCGCNFGQGPSPHHYCWSIAAFDIHRGHYGKIKLSGLHLVRGHGKEAVVWYIDDRATPEQASALHKIAAHISASLIRRRPSFVHFEKARITQLIGKQGESVNIAGKGGFEADYIIGGDGKHPINIQNMTAWNVHHDLKAKTKRLHYKDQYDSQFYTANTNANEGKFDWTDRTRWYL